jgi:hypothetical protein
VCGGNAPGSKIICTRCLDSVSGDHQKYAEFQKTTFRIPPPIKAKKETIIRMVQQMLLPISA